MDDWTTRGRSLRAEAHEARHARDETGTSPVERENIRKLMEAEWPEVLDDSDIAPPSRPQQSVERVTTPPMSSFDLWDRAR